MAHPVDRFVSSKIRACRVSRGLTQANLAKEIADGATSIIPIGLVSHLLMRDEGDTLKVGTGEYNRALDKKIAQIKTQCGIK